MPFELKNVVPWGRSFEEYTSMFFLTEDDLNRKILGCSDGPASFNSQMKKNGQSCISIDPIYQFTAKEIKKQIDESFDKILNQTRKNRIEFVWENISSVEELGQIRKKAMGQFLKDFELGKKENRYIAGELPKLVHPANEYLE